MRGKGDYRLALKIITLQKCIYCHRQVAPPYRIAKKYHVVSVHVFELCAELWTGIFALFLFRDISRWLVLFRIRLYSLDMKERGVYLGGYHLG